MAAWLPSSGWILEEAAGVLPHTGRRQETGREEHVCFPRG